MTKHDSHPAHAPLLLLGATDLTLAIANHLVDRAQVALAGVMSLPAEFRISYSVEPVRNSRWVDMRKWSEQRGLPFRSYTKPADISAMAAATGAGAALFAGWYHIVPGQIRSAFPRGCIGVHASLLPRYRGGAPLNWAMLNGEREAGVSLFEFSDGVDEGPLFDQRRFSIEPDDYIADVLRKAETATLEMLSASLPGLLAGTLRPRPQQGEPTYCDQRKPSDGSIDWRQPATVIARLVRSVSRPYPGARARLDGQELTIWRARAADENQAAPGTPGDIVRLPGSALPGIVTGRGVLLLEEVEGPGGVTVETLAERQRDGFGVTGP